MKVHENISFSKNYNAYEHQWWSTPGENPPPPPPPTPYEILDPPLNLPDRFEFCSPCGHCVPVQYPGLDQTRGIIWEGNRYWKNQNG